jgi:uncharacterized protein involved in cysteine biosynthesis
LRGVVALSLAIAVVTFIALWTGVAVGLGHLPTLGWWPVNWLVDVLGGVGVLLLSWLLFPTVVTLITGLFLERIAAAVEATDHPGRGPPRRQSLGEIVTGLARLALLSVALNLLALPLYLLLPVLNIVIYVALNGMLLGREYFDVVALRRLDVDAARAVRRQSGGRVFFAGVIIAALFAVPLVNLVAAAIATAFMVQVFEELRRPAVARATF